MNYQYVSNNWVTVILQLCSVIMDRLNISFTVISMFSTLCLQKVPTVKLSVTLSNLNRFSKFLHARKRLKFATKSTQHYPPHLRHVATLPWEIKKSNFLQIFSRFGKMKTNCILIIPSNFVIYPQILIFSVSNIARSSPY